MSKKIHFIDQREMEQIHYMGYLLSLDHKTHNGFKENFVRPARKKCVIKEVTQSLAAELFELWKNGNSYAKIARMYDLHIGTVGNHIRKEKKKRGTVDW